MDDAYVNAGIQSEITAKQREQAIVDRAQLIVRLLRGENETGRRQAEAAVERACRAEAALAAIRGLPSHEDLLTNPVARAMYERADRVTQQIRPRR